MTSVRDQILDYAQALVQTRGYNAMSFRDLANEIGIKTSSIHYYFPSKEDLALALVNRYRESFKDALSTIDSETKDPNLKLKRYVDLFVATVRAGKICLCGMFASDQLTLPASTQSQVKKFFIENEEWLAKLLNEGREQGKFTFEGSALNKAETIFSMLEGTMIAARLFKDEKRLLSAAKWVQNSLSE